MTEFFKTVLIFVLTLSMIFLLVCFFVVTVASDALSPADLLFEFTRASGGTEPAAENTPAGHQTAAFPCQIAFLSGMGELYMPISYREYQEALTNTTQILEEAVGSAYGYSLSSQNEYLSMLLAQGILFVYDYPVPFYMLCSWANYGYTGEDINVSSLYICAEGGSVTMMVRDESGSCHSFLTQANPLYLSRLCSINSPNGKISAMADPTNPSVDLPVLSGGINLPSYTLSPLFEDEAEISRELLSVLAINPYLSSVYRDGDTTIYMEENNRLHLYADGHLSYWAAEDGGIPVQLPEEPTENNVLLTVTERARQVVFALWDELSDSNVKLSLADIEVQGEALTIYFEAYIGGSYISMGDKAAAAVLYENGRITDISVYPLSLTRAGDRSLLPFEQAQAAAGQDAVLRIQYVLGEDLSVVPVIVDVREGK